MAPLVAVLTKQTTSSSDVAIYSKLLFFLPSNIDRCRLGVKRRSLTRGFLISRFLGRISPGASCHALAGAMG